MPDFTTATAASACAGHACVGVFYPLQVYIQLLIGFMLHVHQLMEHR
jgi:hypothetical protein